MSFYNELLDLHIVNIVRKIFLRVLNLYLLRD